MSISIYYRAKRHNTATDAETSSIRLILAEYSKDAEIEQLMN